MWLEQEHKPRNLKKKNPNLTFGFQFLQVLRLMVQVVRDEDVPLPPPCDHSPDDDFLRIELDGWYNDEEDEDSNDTEFQNHKEEEEEGNEDEEEDEDRSSDNEDKENRDR